jgi:ABC-2 type transport system ATP-binding protein/ribosome-dependent ATPase
VPQGLGLYRDLTAAENLAFVAGSYGVNPGPAPPGSGGLVGEEPLGMQRQIAFAAALQHRPDLLILDEPTSGVAPLARARLWERIREAAEGGAAVLVSTHSMDEARQADRLVLMHRGRVIGRGREAEIVGTTRAVTVAAADWHHAFTVLESSGYSATLAGTTLRVPGAGADEIERILGDGGIEAAVDTVPASLEEAMVLADVEG